MATNSQLSTTESKKTNNKNRRRIVDWRSLGGLSAGREKGENGGKVQGIRSKNAMYKIDRGM